MLHYVLNGVVVGLMAIYFPLLDCGHLLDSRLLDLTESHTVVIYFLQWVRGEKWDVVAVEFLVKMSIKASKDFNTRS